MRSNKILAWPFLVALMLVGLGCSTPSQTEKARIQKAASRAISEVEKMRKANNNSLKKAQQIPPQGANPKCQCQKKSGRCPICKSVLSIGCGSRVYIEGDFPLRSIRIVLDGKPTPNKPQASPFASQPEETSTKHDPTPD